MNLRKKALMNVLLGAGLYLLDPVRDRLVDEVEDLRDRAKDTYDVASRRATRASDAIRGTDHHFLSAAASALLGIGIGVGVGFLLASAGGESGNRIADRVRDMSDNVKSRFSGSQEEPSRSFGT